MSTEPLVIVNQIDPAFGAFLRGLDCAPTVIDTEDPDRPWIIPATTDVLITRGRGWQDAPASAPELPRLRWVQTYSAGVESYPDWLKSGRIVTTGRGLTAPQIAEYVLSSMLRVERRIDEIRARSAADWIEPQLGTLEGKTLGVIGYGAIGQETIRRAQAFGMQIVASRRGGWATPVPGIVGLCSAEEVMSRADHLVLALPLTPKTRGMFGSEMFSAARRGQHFVNISRGGLVDQSALISALDAGQLGFATLDVTDPEPLPDGHPLYTHQKVLITPHVSYVGAPEVERFQAKVAANLRAFLAGTEMTDVLVHARGY